MIKPITPTYHTRNNVAGRKPAFGTSKRQLETVDHQHVIAAAKEEAAKIVRDVALVVVSHAKSKLPECKSVTLHTNRENAQQAAQVFSDGFIITWRPGTDGELIGTSADLSFHIRKAA